MDEKEAIAQLENEYLAVSGNETSAKVRYHNEALDVAIAALEEVQEYHATGHTPKMVRELRRGYIDAHKKAVQYAMQLDEYYRLGGLAICKAAVEHCRWIPVTERLPETRETVAFYAKVNNAVYIGNFLYVGKKGTVWFRSSTKRGTNYAAEYWMHLPESNHIMKTDSRAENGKEGTDE